MNIDYKSMVDSHTNILEKKLQLMLCELGFRGNLKNAKDIKKFILDNKLNLETDNNIFGTEYKIIKDGEVLKGFRVVNEMIEDKENLKFSMISRIEDI